MNKKSEIGVGYITAFIIAVVIIFIFASYSPALARLINAATAFGKVSPNDDKSKETKTDIPKEMPQRKEIVGQIGAVLPIKMESSVSIKPTSSNYCLVKTSVTNTGKDTWTESDKMKLVLFCYDKEEQINPRVIEIPLYNNKLLSVQNFPEIGYIDNFAPGDTKEVIFKSNYPNNCVKSNQQYQIVLLSNCEGAGNKYLPCNNLNNPEDTKGAKVIKTMGFYCN